MFWFYPREHSLVYLDLTCSVSSGSGHVEKRVTVFTFFRCPKILVLAHCGMHPCGLIWVKFRSIYDNCLSRWCRWKFRQHNGHQFVSASLCIMVDMTPRDRDDHWLLLWISLHVLGIRSEAYALSFSQIYFQWKCIFVSHHYGSSDTKYY